MPTPSQTRHLLHKGIEEIARRALDARVEFARIEGSSQIDTDSMDLMVRHKLANLEPHRNALVSDLNAKLRALEALDLTTSIEE